MSATDNSSPQKRPLWSLENLKGDFAGGVAATMVSLPLSMTIGVIAFSSLGKDFVVQGVLAGVYGAIILGFFSALFGARSILVSGPRAASALILASLMSQVLLSEDLMFPTGQTVGNVISIAFFAIFLAGAIQFLFGVTRIGNIVRNVPHPVVAGFINSTALLIIMGQVWVLLDIPKRAGFLEEVSFLDLFERIGEAQPMSMIPGLATIAVMIVSSKHVKAIPASLAGLIAGTAVYYAMREALDGYDMGPTLGEVTSRFPVPQLDMLPSLTAGGDWVAVALMVLPAALSMAVLASLDTLFSLSALDDLTDQRTDANRELIGHGIGNMASALAGGLIGAGGMVRAKPGFDAGGRTPAMTIFSSALMLAAVLLFAELIEYIPRAVISGMILVLGFQIFDRWSLLVLKGCISKPTSRKVSSLTDALIIFLVVSVALAFNLIVAVAVGLGIAFVLFVSRMSRSLIRNEYRGPGFHARSVWDLPRQALLDKHAHRIAVLELEGTIFFGTADSLEGRIHDLMRDGITHIVLDMKRVNDIDSTGVIVLQRIQQRLLKHDGILTFGYLLKERRSFLSERRKDRPAKEISAKDRRRKTRLRHIWVFLQSSGAIDKLGEGNFFPDTDSALAVCENDLIKRVSEDVNQALGKAIRILPIMRGLSSAQIKQIRRLFTRHFFKAGETIFDQGDPGDCLYYISRGRAVVLVYLHETGNNKRIQSLLRGAVFGEMSLLDGKPRAASVVAAQDTICYRLGVDEFETIKSRHPAIANQLFTNICIMFSERIRSANTMIAELEK